MIQVSEPIEQLFCKSQCIMTGRSPGLCKLMERCLKCLSNQEAIDSATAMWIGNFKDCYGMLFWRVFSIDWQLLVCKHVSVNDVEAIQCWQFIPRAAEEPLCYAVRDQGATLDGSSFKDLNFSNLMQYAFFVFSFRASWSCLGSIYHLLFSPCWFTWSYMLLKCLFFSSAVVHKCCCQIYSRPNKLLSHFYLCVWTTILASSPCMH